MTAKDIATRLLGNAAFVNACDLHLKKITADGRITAADIPYFILIIGTVNQYRGRIKFQQDQIVPVLRELSIMLFKKLNLFDNEADKDAAVLALDMFLPLVEMSINLAKGTCKCFACFRPDTSEEDMTNEINVIADRKAPAAALEEVVLEAEEKN